MAHISLPDGLPGIIGPLTQYPETGRPLGEFTQVLLRSTNGLTPAEREMIAAHVSTVNDCTFCSNSHSAAARALLEDRAEVMDQVRADPESAPISEKMKALLALAGKVAISGRAVLSDDVERARIHGATDRDIHDAVLIAAAFCMFNRYVDGLATLTPEEPVAYAAIGERLAEAGYRQG